MASNFDGIQIVPSVDTRKKIATYAIMSGQNVDEVVNQLESLLNETLTQKCIELLGGPIMMGADQGITYPITEKIEEIPVRNTAKKKSFADIHKQAAAPPSVEEPEEEEAFSTADETGTAQHELSADEDSQDNKSLEEQVEGEDELPPEDEEEFKQAFSRNKVKDVGKNAEAFLDNAMGEPEEEDTDEIPRVTRGYAGTGMYGDRPVTATKSFESRLRKGVKARVAAYTGEED